MMFGWCWHDYTKWSEPFQGKWTVNREHHELLLGVITDRKPEPQVIMTQMRTCKKCGKVQYRKVR